MIERIENRTLLSSYFVSAAGNDAADGSVSAPWATLARVNAADLEPGDSVSFRGGDTFAGSLLLDALDAGTAAAPVSVGSYGTGRATIYAGAGDGISAFNAGGIEISGLNVVGSGTQAPQQASGIEFPATGGRTSGRTSTLEPKIPDGLKREPRGRGDAGPLELETDHA